MIWATEPTGSVTYIGPEWTSFTGQFVDEAYGSGWLAMLHPDDRVDVETFFLDACYANASFTMQFRLKRTDGTYARVVSGASPSISPIDGRFLGYLGAVSEVVTAVHGLSATRQIGKLVLPPPIGTTMPLTLLDVVADQGSHGQSYRRARW